MPAAAEFNVGLFPSAYEGLDSAVTFVVTLSPALTERATVDYRTSDYPAPQPVTEESVASGLRGLEKDLSDFKRKYGRYPESQEEIDNHSGWWWLINFIHGLRELSIDPDRSVRVPYNRGVVRDFLNRMYYVDSKKPRATAGEDYTAVSGTLTFEPGETRKEVQVPILDDDVPDDNGSFSFRLSNPTGAGLGHNTSSGENPQQDAGAADGALREPADAPRRAGIHRPARVQRGVPGDGGGGSRGGLGERRHARYGRADRRAARTGAGPSR